MMEKLLKMGYKYNHATVDALARRTICTDRDPKTLSYIISGGGGS
jgi:hypothetical protein